LKRSEILSKIASVIINYNEVGSIINRDKALEMAETILKVQEESGMLPPRCQLPTLGISDNAWESENE
jgi:hypothetical protein